MNTDVSVGLLAPIYLVSLLFPLWGVWNAPKCV